MADILKTIKPPGLIHETLCRPIHRLEALEIVYTKQFPLLETAVSIRPLCLHTDVETILEWVNHEYGGNTWQKGDGPVRQLKQTYELILNSDFAQSFVALINDTLVCQLDVYNAGKNEISLVYDAREGDYGINILMSPSYEKNSILSVCVLHTFLEYFFSLEEVKRIIGEPDMNDLPANELFAVLGFRFLKKTVLSYKWAHLYTCTKDNFSEAIRTFAH